MKRLSGIKDVQEASEGFKRPEAGGYICKITYVEDIAEKEYLHIEYDFAEGEFKDYYKDLKEKKGFWLGRFYKSYKEKALPFFKAFCTAVTESNEKYIFDGDDYADEKTLIGKKIGLVLGEEEFIKGDGSIGTRLYVANTFSVDRIRKGDFKVPEYKHLQGSSTPDTIEEYITPPTPSLEDELPFK